MHEIDNKAEIKTEGPIEKSGWSLFDDELSFFIVDFFKNRLTPEEKLIFFSYYINGMTLKDIAERLYNKEEIKKFKHEKESEEDDIEIKHISFQRINMKLQDINKMIKNEWKYVDRWR